MESRIHSLWDHGNNETWSLIQRDLFIFGIKYIK